MAASRGKKIVVYLNGAFNQVLAFSLHNEKVTTSRSKKKTIVVHLNGAFTPMTNRDLSFFLRCHFLENIWRIWSGKEIHINRIKFWLFHYKMTTAVGQILRTLLLRKGKPTISVIGCANASRRRLNDRTLSGRQEAQKRKVPETLDFFLRE